MPVFKRCLYRICNLSGWVPRPDTLGVRRMPQCDGPFRRVRHADQEPAIRVSVPEGILPGHVRRVADYLADPHQVGFGPW
ncbi:MAG: hypothetical protein JXB85_12305 [Anaerolineales bacterium]|nr:hypothetical protein [Anaerolineales bacterium]